LRLIKCIQQVCDPFLLCDSVPGSLFMNVVQVVRWVIAEVKAVMKILLPCCSEIIMMNMKRSLIDFVFGVKERCLG
jgi:hypothetical protein